MKTLPWLVAALGLGIAAYILGNTPAPQYATGSDSLEDAARGASQWGSKKRLSGKATNVVGKIKKGFGRAAGNPNLAVEGADDQAFGAVKDAAGEVAQAAGQTLHDLNR